MADGERGAVSRATEWRRINELFHAALERPRTERDAFLEGACADRPALRREIEALILAYETDPDFLEHGVDLVRLLVPEGQPRDHTHAAAHDDTRPLAAGSRLGRYVIEQELGRGGMGVVYLARDGQLNRSVAIKLLPAAVADDQVRRARLRREAQAAAALSHPGIATVHALEEADGVLFIVSEYVRGQTLRDELEASGPVRGDELLETALDIARALAAAHRQGVIHRDLKPENVVRTEHGIKIVDFGLAQLTTDPRAELPARLTRSGMVVGTPAYMSPEQLRGEEADQRCDQFGFGLLVYELAAGRHPFGGTDVATTWARILRDEATPLVSDDAVVVQLQPLIARCLAKDPAERFHTTDDLVSAIVAAGRLSAVALAKVDRHSPAEAARPTNPALVTSSSVAGPPQPAPRMWWEVHQIVVSLVYGLMLWPMWMVRPHVASGTGRTLLLVALVAVVAVAASLRLNLAFTSRCYPAALRLQRRRVSGLVRLADWAFGVLLLVGAAIVGNADVELTALLVGVAIGASVAFLFIEPATAHAALDGLQDRTAE
ncbi:MAG: protein kinase [Luteitalea sp.]|nr:protein kinase [Luteitalea sp.]